jgi:hypothetical protein
MRKQTLKHFALFSLLMSLLLSARHRLKLEASCRARAQHSRLRKRQLVRLNRKARRLTPSRCSIIPELFPPMPPR